MRRAIYMIGLFIALSLFNRPVAAQLIDIKPWHGYYPEMKGSYPLSFVAFKGWLIPRPHYFVRTWPTHYYLEVGALPVSDTGSYTDQLRINLVKLIARLIERGRMKDRHQATNGIRDNRQAEKAIEQLIQDSRFDELPDIFDLTGSFVKLYKSIKRIDQLDNCSWLKETLEKDADRLLTRFISVNFLQTDHGEKLAAFAEIRKELNQQTGDADYTYRKVHYYQYYAKQGKQSWSFLSR